MKNLLMVGGIVVVALLLVVGYKEKHQIKMMLTGSSSTQAVDITMNTTPSASPAAMTQTANTMTKTDAKKGSYLTDSRGMTLYTFDKDKTNTSTCSGQCAALWPAYTTSSAPATMPTNFSVFKRADNTMQYAYKGMPLYFYSGDKNAGDINGDNFGKVWHIITQ